MSRLLYLGALTVLLISACQRTASSSFDSSSIEQSFESSDVSIHESSDSSLSSVDPSTCQHLDIVIDEKVDATGQSVGHTEGSHCALCGTVIKEQKPLYFDYIGYDKNEKISIKNGVGEVYKNHVSLQVGNAQSSNFFVSLTHNGVLTNTTPVNQIKRINIVFAGDTRELYFYSGDHALPYQNEQKVIDGRLQVELNNSRYFLISYRGNSVASIDSFSMTFQFQDDEPVEELPVFEIRADGPINSKETYTSSTFALTDPSNEKNNMSNVTGGIRIRGNSTSDEAKKPYRIKFDKKQSLFGLKKAKSWVLLAEYYDCSSMHNYIAHKFVSLFDNSKFVFHPHHVIVTLNGTYQGLYVLMEHPDEKEGRLGIEQDITLDTPVENLNFLIEYDGRADQNGVLDKTYISIRGNSDNEKYEIKYPEIDEFPDYNPSTDSSAMFNSFIAYLKSLLGNAWNAIRSRDDSRIREYFDIQSFYNQGMLDIFADERDHSWLSYKMFKDARGKINSGPCWDYDITAWGYYWTGEYYKDPYKDCQSNNDYASNYWLKIITNDITSLSQEFRAQFKAFLTKNQSQIHSFFEEEIGHISEEIIRNASLWQEDNLSYAFENIRYFNQYLLNRYSALQKTILK